jgi:hypothetical protein
MAAKTMLKLLFLQTRSSRMQQGEGILRDGCRLENGDETRDL